MRNKTLLFIAAVASVMALEVNGANPSDYRSVKPSQCTAYERDENGDFYGRNYYAPAVYVPGQGIKITWKRSASENVTYRVVRLSDNKEIVTDATENVATDTDFTLDSPAIYQYSVEQNAGEGYETLYTTSAVSLNNQIPFEPSINEEALNDFTIIDSNRDVNTWNVVLNGSADKHGVTAWFTTARRGDDWMISPGHILEAGKTYCVEVDALCTDLVPSTVGFQIMAGKSNSVESMTEEILPTVTFEHMFPKTYKGYYTPSETGNVFFGFRSIDPLGTNKFDDMGLSSISIKEVPGGTPEAIKDLRAQYGSIAGAAQLVFTAPLKSVDGSQLSSLEKIEVIKDGESVNTIANPTPGQQYGVDVTFTAGTMSTFQVIATTASGSGIPATVEILVLDAPYSTTFDTEDELAGYTILEPNVTNNTWGYLPINQAVRCFAFVNETNDDYLISPGIFLEKGNYYKIDFLTWLGKEDSYHDYNNTIEVLLGKEPTIEALTTTIIEPYTVYGTFGGEVLLKNWFTVPETGYYYIAWHAKSEENLGQELFIDNVNISAKIPDSYPAGVDNLKITPDAAGALTAMVEFDLPAKDMAGNDMANDFYAYKLFCDGLEISNGAGERGKHIAFAHETTKGLHLYTVRCYGAENEPTRDVETVAYVGINRPGAVEFVEVVENPEKYGEVTITWGLPVSDIDGFALNTSDITYTVGQYIVDPNTGTQKEEVYATGLTGFTYTKTVKTNADEQEFMRFFVRPKTSAGEGAPTVITRFTAVGKPFDLPFMESFAGGLPQHIMMQERPFEGKQASWGYNVENPITGVQPVDGDKGLALMETLGPDNGARLFTLRINLNEANPLMTFYVYNQSREDLIDENLLGISIREGNDDFKTINSKSINDWANGNPGWQKATLDLTDYAGKVVYIGFEGLAKTFTFIHVDNIMIASKADIDAAVKVVSHPKIYVGVEHSVEVKLQNVGGQDLESATVNLYLDDEVIAENAVSDLKVGEERVLTFSNKLTRADLGKHCYKAIVSAYGDADLLNNSVESTWFYLQDNDFPKVENLQAATVGTETQLSWDMPVIPDEPQQITDDFESYPSWSTMYTGGLGDYTLVDGDGCEVGGFENVELPNIPIGSKQSFTLWDFSNEIFAQDQTISDRYKAHSGDKCLVSIFASGEDGWVSDRLISPRLSGEAQTIQFYAKSLQDPSEEIFQVYYSFDGVSLNDYVDNRFPRQTVGGEWTQFSYELPEGTQYFVIERYSNGFFLFIDDLTYIPVGDETLENNGYNVYRNDELLNDMPITELTWTDNNTVSEADVKYGVSVVYDRGESPVSEVVVESSGLNDLSASSITVQVRNREIIIEGAQGMDIAVVTASGMVLTSRQASAFERVPVTPGIYVVKAGGRVIKVAVK